jgi:hypothetical protein
MRAEALRDRASCREKLKAQPWSRKQILLPRGRHGRTMPSLETRLAHDLIHLIGLLNAGSVPATAHAIIEPLTGTKFMPADPGLALAFQLEIARPIVQ